MSESDLRIEYLPLSRVVKWAKNPKRHDVPLLRESFARFGFIDPIIVEERTGELLSGHGRVESLEVELENGAEEPPEHVRLGEGGVWLVPVVRGVELEDDNERAAAALALNRVGELGGWGAVDLEEVLQDLGGSLEGTGFTDEDGSGEEGLDASDGYTVPAEGAGRLISMKFAGRHVPMSEEERDWIFELLAQHVENLEAFKPMTFGLCPLGEVVDNEGRQVRPSLRLDDKDIPIDGEELTWLNERIQDHLGTTQTPFGFVTYLRHYFEKGLTGGK